MGTELKLSSQILNLILQIENVPERYEGVGIPRNVHLDKIAQFVREGVPVHMILPAFPAKSPNPRKTVGHLPDYGEVLGLKRLHELCERIGQIYAPGARLTICSDGRVFSDVVRVDDADVDVYGNKIREIIRENGFTTLETFCLEDLFANRDFDGMRARLNADYAEDLASLRERVKTQDEMRAMFNGIHRFMFEDQSAFHPLLSKNALREKAKGLAYEVIRRSNAWSKLVEERFPAAIRLSIHPQLPGSAKIGIRLVPSNDMWRTPWHSVAVFDGREFVLMPRSQAEDAGAVLSYAEDKYPFYVLQARKVVSL